MASRLDDKHMIYIISDNNNIFYSIKEIEKKIQIKNSSSIKKLVLIEHNKKNKLLYQEAYFILKEQSNKDNAFLKRVKDNYTFQYFKNKEFLYSFKMVVLRIYTLSDIRIEKIKNILS